MKRNKRQRYIFPFSENKAKQVIGCFLRLERSHSMSIVRLQSLLYILDRESIKKICVPITCDYMVATNHGPALGTIHSIFARNDYLSTFAEWQQNFHLDGFRLSLIGEPIPIGELSRHDIGLITEVSEKYWNTDDWALVEEIKKFPEWVKKEPLDGNINNIACADVLESLGMPEKEESILRHGEERTAIDNFWNSMIRSTPEHIKETASRLPEDYVVILRKAVEHMRDSGKDFDKQELMKILENDLTSSESVV